MADLSQDTTSKALSDPQEWVDRYGDLLYRYAFARLRNPTAAEEVVQETFLAALTARERFSGKSSERTWLVGILKHKIIDTYRKRSREELVEDIEPWVKETDSQVFDGEGHWRVAEGEGPVDWGPDAASAIDQQAFQQVLAGCLQALPQRIAKVFTLREMDELPTDEVCKLMNITSTNLWVILHRARFQLRQCLEVKWFGKKTQ